MNWKTAERVLFDVSILATASWCIASISYPMGYDQGVMAAIGDVIIRGGLPYRDGFDVKGPLVFYVFAFAQVLFGRVMWGIRVVDLSLVITAAGFLYSMLKRMLLSATIARWMALSLVLAGASRSWFHVSQPDGWAAALVVVAVCPLIGRERRPRIAWLASGLLIGAAALIKPFYILFLAVPIALAAPAGLSAAAVPIVVLVSGAALPILGMSTWFWLNGALDDLVSVHVIFNIRAYSGIDSFSIRDAIQNIDSYLRYGAPLKPRGPFGVLLVPILAGVIMAWRERRTVGLGLLVWLTVAVACVAAQGKFFVQHWLIAFPPLLVTAALGLARLSDDAPFERVLPAVAIGVFVAGVAIHPVTDTWNFVRYFSGLDSRGAYHQRFERFSYRPFSAEKAAAYIKARTRADERVIVYGEDSIVQFLSERASPTRFVFAYPLDVRNRFYRDRHRAEFIRDLRRRAPRYLVLGTRHDETTLAAFPELRELLAQRYRLDTTFGRLELYRLDDGFQTRAH